MCKSCGAFAVCQHETTLPCKLLICIFISLHTFDAGFNGELRCKEPLLSLLTFLRECTSGIYFRALQGTPKRSPYSSSSFHCKTRVAQSLTGDARASAYLPMFHVSTSCVAKCRLRLAKLMPNPTCRIYFRALQVMPKRSPIFLLFFHC